jgi:hypothetical protein
MEFFAGLFIAIMVLFFVHPPFILVAAAALYLAGAQGWAIGMFCIAMIAFAINIWKMIEGR